MKPKTTLPSLFLLLALLLMAGQGHAQTAFTYQGQLRDGSTNANGNYSLTFKLFDNASGGTQIGGTLTAPNQSIVNGLFTVALDFGGAAFDGNARWLEITVQTLTATNTLAPRVAVLPTPYALFATKAGSVVNGAVQNPSFIGTTLNAPFEIFVNNTRAFRLEPNANSPNIIGGFRGNNVAVGVNAATIAGGGWPGLVNQVSADYGSIGGGNKNTVSGEKGTIAGGQANSALSPFATVGGGQENVANGGNFATISGGGFNSVTGDAGYIGGGYGNVASALRSAVVGGTGNNNNGADGLIGSGYANSATGIRPVIVGGYYCVNNGQDATLGAGNQNTISGNSPYGVLSGGYLNLANGYASVIGGGQQNVVSSNYATVSGGYQNTASGNTATVAGGQQNTASGALSYAAGQRAKANHQGSFVWADSTAADFTSTATDQFSARARGGVRFVSATDGSGAPSAGVQLAAGSGGWSSLSDRASKTNFQVVDGRDILSRLAGIPILSWNYKTQVESIRHMGPVAQDFSAAFNVGEDDKHINTIDADGVAFAAIQGLLTLAKEKDAEIAVLKKRLETLERIVLKQNGGAQ